MNIIRLSVIGLLLCGCAQSPLKSQLNGGKNIGDSSSPPVNNIKTDSNSVVSAQDIERFLETKHLMANNNFPIAEAKLRNLVAKNPQFSAAWANLGVIYSETNRLDEAEKALQKAIALDNTMAAVYSRLGYVYKKQGRITQAISMYEKSLAVDPNYANVRYNISILYDLYMQDPQKAIVHLTKYVELNGKDKETDIWLQQLQRKVQKDALNQKK